MKIRCSNPATRMLRITEGTASFDVNGYATVPKELGEALAAAYPNHIEVVKQKATRKSKEEG